MTAVAQNGLASVEPSSSPSQPAPTTTDTNSSTDNNVEHPAPPSPVRPPVSPITPATTFAQLATPLPPNGLPPLDTTSSSQLQPPKPSTSQKPKSQSRTQPVKSPVPPTKPIFISVPNPIPFEESESTDAAALRAAIAVLQIQKEKSRQDIKTLQELRQGLLKDPDAFTQELIAGRLKEEKSSNDPLHATFASPHGQPGDDVTAGVETSPDIKATDESASRYPPIPSAQNVIRCPPINWTKYHIAGEPLDRMHEEQRKRPTPGEPVRDASLQQHQTTTNKSPSAEHHVFAPYEPWRDKPTTAAEQLGLGMQTRRAPKKVDPATGGSFVKTT